MKVDKAKLLIALREDEEFRLQVVKELSSDQEFKNMLGREVLAMPMTEIGVNVPGTLLEFLLKFNKPK